MTRVNDWRAWGLIKQQELASAFPSMRFDAVTVIICCKDKAHVLPLVLAALDNQIVPASRWILTDDHSSDNSVAVFRDFCLARGIAHDVRQPGTRAVFQLNTLRNLGFEAAEDGLVIVIDGDLIVGPGFIQAHQHLHTSAAQPVSSVGPLFEAADDHGNGPINFMWGHESWAHVSHPSTGTVPTWATVLGGNLGLHRETWRLLGGFDAIYDGNYGVDDQDLHYRLSLSGVHHVGNFQAHVIHLPHENALGTNRDPNINLNKFRDKYGFTLYSRRNVPDQIDWLGWADGPWNRIARRLLAGDVSASVTRGAHIAYTNPSAVSRRVTISERTVQILRQVFDPAFVRRQVPCAVNDAELFYAFLNDGDFRRVMPNLYFDLMRIEELVGTSLESDEHLSAAFVEKGFLDSVGPHPAFLPGLYTRMHPGTVPAGTSPFVHFWTCGRAAGLSPNPLIDLGFYALHTKAKPMGEVDGLLVDQLFTAGVEACVRFSPYFDTEYYDCNSKRHDSKENWALAHFYSTPPEQRLSPNPHVSFYWYRENYGDFLEGMDPLTHFLMEGSRRGFRPNPFFGPGKLRSASSPCNSILCYYLPA